MEDTGRPPVGMPPGLGAWVFSVVAEGVVPLVCARYKFCDPMLIEVVASPLRVCLTGVVGDSRHVRVKLVCAS